MGYNYTMAINQGEPAAPPKDRNRARPAPERAPVTAPVLGWLVCASGFLTGQDIPLFKQVTHIAKGMDISPESLGCAAENAHLVISYDKGGNRFSIRQEDQKLGSPAALNGAALTRQDQSLKACDVIQLPGASLFFVPFCEGSRKWD
ncbi:MAG: hypothetical protein LBS62_12520 [Clostridiales bacterium]|jgi:hypothetical protein|nr:hypothetical protein [Clostridiales bacterium]